jgi:hypothetical protein
VEDKNKNTNKERNYKQLRNERKEVPTYATFK